MTELKIPEHRYLSLIESEKLVPKIIKGFITHIVEEWKKVSEYETQEQRAALGPYVQACFDKHNLGTEVYFNNSYHSLLMFRYYGEEHFVEVTPINPFTGKSIDPKYNINQP